VEKVCRAALQKGYTMKDIQVLAPIYKGEYGIRRLNERLQRLFNPPHAAKREVVFGDVVFRTGDKVLQLSNDPEKNVYNGDIGEIVATEPDGEIPLVVLFDQIEVPYQKSELIQLTHAFCSSVHKAEGSEFPIVILPFAPAYKRMLKRNLLYTAITRAKKSLVLLGDPALFGHAVMTNDVQERFTYLAERLFAMNTPSIGTDFSG
jgi:exodeoxyribonuclease V alpha subunit